MAGSLPRVWCAMDEKLSRELLHRLPPYVLHDHDVGASHHRRSCNGEGDTDREPVAIGSASKSGMGVQVTPRDPSHRSSNMNSTHIRSISSPRFGTDCVRDSGTDCERRLADTESTCHVSGAEDRVGPLRDVAT